MPNPNANYIARGGNSNIGPSIGAQGALQLGISNSEVMGKIKSITRLVEKLQAQGMTELEISRRTSKEWAEFIASRVEVVRKEHESIQDYFSLLDEQKKFQKLSSTERLNTLAKEREALNDEAKSLKARHTYIEDQLKRTDLSDAQKIALEKSREEVLKEEESLLKKRTKYQDKEAALSKSEQKYLDKQKAREKKAAEQEAAAQNSIKDALKPRLANPEQPFEEGSFLDSLDHGLSGIGKMIDKALSSIAAAADHAFSNAESVLNETQAKVSTRLEGSGRDYKDITSLLRKSFAMSSIVSQEQILKNLTSLVESGVAYNVEQRAFLKTISDDISSTFDAFSKDMERIIRLQREDSSFARMGLETHLQRMFNEFYLDSSYLNDQYDQVTGALIDATSQLGAKQSAEFEYTVQKWLGALYSAGASSSFISQIASGLNLLGTGAASQLSGPIGNLLVASTSRSKELDYASLLTGGLNAENTNLLLKSMVDYLASIAEDTKSNKVTSYELGKEFGVSLSDLKAVTTVVQDVDKIFSNVISYEQMAGVTENRIQNIGNNYSLSKRASTLFNNLMFSTASSIVESPAGYLTYKAADLIGKLGGNTKFTIGGGLIPTSTTFGLTDVIKDAVFGISMISNIIGGLGSLKNGGSGILGNWLNPGEMRGTQGKLTLSSAQSQSMTYSGNADSGTVTDKSLDAAKQQQADIRKGVEQDSTDISIEDIFYGLFADKTRGGYLTAISNNVYNIGELLKTQAAESAQRVLITGFDIGSDGSFELPVKFGSSGQSQVNKLNDASIANRTENIAMLISLLAGLLANNEAINVNLKSSDVPFTGLVTGEYTSSSEETMPQSSSVAPIIDSTMSRLRDDNRPRPVALMS